jgi:hypothetical protein
MCLKTGHGFALLVPFLNAKLIAQIHLLHDPRKTGTDGNKWTRSGHARHPLPNGTCFSFDPNPEADIRSFKAVSRDSILAAQSRTTVDSLESLIKPATSRDAFLEYVRNKNPLPLAENPLRLVPAMS